MVTATATFPSEPSTAAVDDDEVAGAGVGSVGETLEVGLSSAIVLERLQWAAEENENDATEGRMMMFRCAIILILTTAAGDGGGGVGGVAVKKNDDELKCIAVAGVKFGLSNSP
jgi:hypothetical protein